MPVAEQGDVVDWRRESCGRRCRSCSLRQPRWIRGGIAVVVLDGRERMRAPLPKGFTLVIRGLPPQADPAVTGVVDLCQPARRIRDAPVPEPPDLGPTALDPGRVRQRCRCRRAADTRCPLVRAPTDSPRTSTRSLYIPSRRPVVDEVDYTRPRRSPRGARRQPHVHARGDRRSDDPSLASSALQPGLTERGVYRAAAPPGDGSAGQPRLAFRNPARRRRRGHRNSGTDRVASSSPDPARSAARRRPAKASGNRHRGRADGR